jgi:hypothetical protein
VSTSIPNLSLQRCFNHSLREAAVRCPECRRFFCKECVAEHDDRVICAACLRKITASGTSKNRAISAVIRSVPVIFGILIAWFFFFTIGETLLRLPSSFHDTSVWRTPWINPQ